MDGLDEDKVRRMMNHINSYPREKWNGKAPIDVFANIYGDQIAAKLGLERFETDEILLRPTLIR